MADAARVSSGSGELDRVLDGLIPGDNVVWVGANPSLWEIAEARFLAQASDRRPTVVIACSKRELRRPVAPGAELVDASTSSPLSRPAPLVDSIEEWLARHPGGAISMRGFADLSHRWGGPGAVRFFARACPTMLQSGAVTYWWVPADLGSSVLDPIRQITQVMLEVVGEQLRITKAESRPDGIVGSVYEVTADDGDVVLRWNPAAGRLARGLAALRRELGLTQAELARAAGVTPSAISQAESGTRGLSLDTLITLAERLDVSLDRLVGSRLRPGYWLARHDRSKVTYGRGVTALVGDLGVGLRAYFVALDGDEEGAPPIPHHGAQLIAVVRGLVQVDAGDDAPVLRAGDSLLVTTAVVSRWRNLRPEPAAFYWVLRD